ncbi:metallophosphoesterase [Roseovarius sp. EL26]|uniref:metallophosphoesterase family protein n=1 Tax=Roseovarius sp. EL26 TaxID=2126672 RepID=UPI0013C4F6A6|nr:metallophosphoesterase [Roseovarius sp. EL26]
MALPFYRATVDILPEGVSSFILTSDLQGREQDQEANRLVGEAVAEELSLLYELGDIPFSNFVALAGDLYDHPELHKLGGTGDVTAVWNAFAKHFKFVVGVHGNHDIVDPQLMAKNTLVLDGTTCEIAGVSIGGVSGIIGRTDRNQRKSEKDFIKALQKVVREKNDLILLHQGPADLENAQLGEPEITSHLKSYGSGVVAFGHCHWEIPMIEIGKNQALNIDNRLYVVTAENTRI